MSNVTSFLQKNVNLYPTKPALGFKKDHEWKELGWYQLKRLVFKTANALKASGVKENDKVSIYADNSAEWIIFDLAIMAIGAVTVPVYSTNGEDQVEYIIKDSGAEIIFAGNQEQYNVCLNLLNKGLPLKQIIITKKYIKIKENSSYLETFIESASEDLEIVERGEDDLATLIYTSGTTGVPKGVMITHSNFLNAFDAHMEFFKFKRFEDEHSLAFLPLTHVFERSWTLLCLHFGAKVSFLENPKLIASALTEVKPTMMCSVPRFYQKIYAGLNEMVNSGSDLKKKIFTWAIENGSLFSEKKRLNQNIPFGLSIKNKVANTLVFNKVKKKLGGKLWFMPCGGASISAEVTQFFDAMGIHITVGYGMTETTATITAFPFTKYKYGTEGKLLGDSQIKIGENDEILVKGSGLMKGYYNKPEETVKVFDENGWMKTGDAGFMDDEGNLVITDRIKDLMKTSNGKYIAPQPIENMFSNNNYINQIMLVAEDKPYVTAVIVPNYESMMEKIKSLGVTFTNWVEVVKNEKVLSFYHQLIDDIQKDLPGFEKIKKFVLMPADFEIQSGEITPTLKIKRNIVIQKYKSLIDSMYHHE